MKTIEQIQQEALEKYPDNKDERFNYEVELMTKEWMDGFEKFKEAILSVPFDYIGSQKYRADMDIFWKRVRGDL